MTAGWIVVVLMGLLTAAAASGSLDPRPAGPLRWQTVPGEMRVPAGGRELVWIDAGPEAGREASERYSLRLTAVHQSGERDVGYGLVVGDADAYLAVAVSPLGYAAVWQTGSGLQPAAFHLPWQPWPHVQSERNEIWLERDGREVTVRVNRELLWAGGGSPGERIGLLLESYGETAVVAFTELGGR